MKTENLPALFIGRFQPFHLGHLDAIRQILRKHTKVIIGIGSAQYKNLPKNPYPSSLRAAMIQKSLRAAKIPKRNFVIIKIPDIHNDTKWVKHVEKLAPKFGTIWSGTPHVRKLFKRDGRHPVVKPKMNVKISGSLIRKKMQQKLPWQNLTPKSISTLL